MKVQPIGIPPAFLNVYRPLWQAAMFRRYLLYTRTYSLREGTRRHPPEPDRQPLPFILTIRSGDRFATRDEDAVTLRPKDVETPELNIQWPGNTPPPEVETVVVERPVPVEVWLTGSVLDVLY